MQSLYTGVIAENLQAAFRITGIYPFDSRAIPSESLIPAEIFAADFESNSQATVEERLNENAAADALRILYDRKGK